LASVDGPAVSTAESDNAASVVKILLMITPFLLSKFGQFSPVIAEEKQFMLSLRAKSPWPPDGSLTP
jgi:hypothetical protein